jgi:hypothetical protein
MTYLIAMLNDPTMLIFWLTIVIAGVGGLTLFVTAVALILIQMICWLGLLLELAIQGMRRVWLYCCK